MTPEERLAAELAHEAWCGGMRRDGWRYGPIEDPELMTGDRAGASPAVHGREEVKHPRIVAFDQLPEHEEIGS